MLSTKRAFIIIAVLYFGLFLSHAIYLGKTVYGDGIFYFSWLRSAVVGRDTDFTDEYRFFSAAQPQLPGGAPGNKYSIGPAVFWSAPYITVHSVVRGNGFTFPYQLAVGASGVLLSLAGLVLLHGTLLTYFPHTAATSGVLMTAFATNLLFYGAIDTVNSHAVGFFAACAFIYYMTNRRKISGFTIGILAGLIFLIRPQDTVLALIAAPFMNIRKAGHLVAGFLMIASLQLLAWQRLYGTFYLSPYVTHGEGFDFFRPRLLEAAFSPSGGLFIWTPALLLSCFGIAIIIRRKMEKWFPIIPAVLFIQLYLIASWSTWWQGATYGSRMFVSMLPLFALGLSGLHSHLLKYRFREKAFMITFVVPYSLLNLVSVTYFLLTN